MLSRVTFLFVAIITSVYPTIAQIRLVYPNGGEYFAFRDTITAQWTGVGPETAVHLSFSYDKGKTWETVAASVKGLAAIFECYDGPANGLLRVVVATDSTQQDQSDSTWYIRRPAYGAMSTMDVDTVTVGEYLDTTITGGVINKGPVPMYVTPSLVDNTHFQFLEPEKIVVVPVGEAPTVKVRFRPIDTGTYRVGILYHMRGSYDFGGGHVRGTARPRQKPKLLITSPIGGTSFLVGDTVRFAWVGLSTDIPVRIEARKEGFAEYQLIDGSVIGGTLRWKIPQSMQGKYRLRCTSTLDSQQSDTLPGLVVFVKPDVSVPEVLDIGQVRVDSQINSYGFFMKNSTEHKVSAEFLKLEGPNADEFTLDASSVTIAPNGGYRLMIKFAPKGSGVREAILTTAVSLGDTLTTLLHGEGVIPSSIEAITGEDIRNDIALQQYPNPVHGIITIEINLETAGLTRLYLHDLMGREAAVLANQPMNGGLSRLNYDMSDLPAGVYYLVLESLNRRETVRIVVE